MVVLDATISTLPLPHIQTALGFSGTGLEWVVNAYALAFGGLLLLGGRSGDLLGRRRASTPASCCFRSPRCCAGSPTDQAWLLTARRPGRRRRVRRAHRARGATAGQGLNQLRTIQEVLVNTLAFAAALTGLLTAGIIYGTDAFCAIVQRPALAQLDDATMTAVMGRVHQYGDRRLPVPGVIGILAAVTATAAWAASGSAARAAAAGLALAAMLAWLSLYLRIAAPVNRTLTKAAVAHVTPDNARALQSRWDSIITTRALLMAVAVAGLAACAATG